MNGTDVDGGKCTCECYVLRELVETWHDDLPVDARVRLLAPLYPLFEGKAEVPGSAS